MTGDDIGVIKGKATAFVWGNFLLIAGHCALNVFITGECDLKELVVFGAVINFCVAYTILLIEVVCLPPPSAYRGY